jgi:pyruvate dehydrogenase E1 component alpha subunit
MRIPDVAARAAAYDIPGGIADGMDFFDVYARAGEAIARAREGKGPTLLECKTYRYYGHYVGDPLTYRTKEESEEMRQQRDPLEAFERRTVGEMGLLDADQIREVDSEVQRTIEDAVAFAEASELPSPEDVPRDVYVSYGGSDDA